MKYEWFCFTRFHSPEECKRIKEFVIANAVNTIQDIPAEQVVKTASVQHAWYGDVKDALEKMTHAVYDSNRRYWGFDLHHISNFDTVHVNTYKEENNGEYGWHTDGVNGEIFDSKLTAILNLSDEEYEGGDLELFLGEPTKINDFRPLGSLIVFPSYLNHRVLPVTKGTRTTLAHWYLGPNWR